MDLPLPCDPFAFERRETPEIELSAGIQCGGELSRHRPWASRQLRPLDFFAFAEATEDLSNEGMVSLDEGHSLAFAQLVLDLRRADDGR